MPLLTFIFGPNNTFFFDSPKSWKFHNIPSTLRQLFNASMPSAHRVQQPYCLALAPPNGASEPIWYIGCKVCDGQDKIFYSQFFFDTNYPDLSNWLKTIPNASRDAFITFGPGLAYFACAPRYGSIWAGIPIDMSAEVQRAYETPNLVSLGMNGAWFVMWPDGHYAWKFYGSYSALDKILNAAEENSIVYLTISPYNKHQFFVVFKDQTVKYSLSKEWMPQMREVFVEWQAEMLQKELARQQQQPHRYSVGGAYPTYNQQWNRNYPPTPGSPQHFSPVTPSTPSSIHSQPFSHYSPYGDAAPPLPPSSPMSMNAVLAPTQPVLPRMMSSASAGAIEKKRPWKRISQAVAPSTGTALTPTVPKVTAEGSQTCVVM